MNIGRSSEQTEHESRRRPDSESRQLFRPVHVDSSQNRSRDPRAVQRPTQSTANASSEAIHRKGDHHRSPTKLIHVGITLTELKPTFPDPNRARSLPEVANRRQRCNVPKRESLQQNLPRRPTKSIDCVLNVSRHPMNEGGRTQQDLLTSDQFKETNQSQYFKIFHIAATDWLKADVL